MHPLAQSLRKLSSGGARCHPDNIGLEEKRKEKKKKVCQVQFYFLLPLGDLCLPPEAINTLNTKHLNRSPSWILSIKYTQKSYCLIPVINTPLAMIVGLCQDTLMRFPRLLSSQN